MSESALPKLADLRKLAARSGCLNGSVPLAELPRIAELVTNEGDEARVKLQGRIDEDQRRLVEGEVLGEFELVCQRCLAPVRVAVQQEVRWALLWSESETQALPREFDPQLCAEDPLPLWDLIEEELLLAMPMVARHEEGKCQSGYQQEQSAAEDAGVKENPFSVLQTLKN